MLSAVSTAIVRSKLGLCVSSSDGSKEMAHRKASMLRVWAFDLCPSLTILVADRDCDRAVFIKLGLSHATRRVISPLSRIGSVQVVKHEHPNAKPAYGIAVGLRDEHHITFGCNSRDQAMHVMRSAARYLGLTHHHNVSLPAQ
jgi:hypothetical protein